MMNNTTMDNDNNTTNNGGLLLKNNPRKKWSRGKYRAQSIKRLKKAVKYASLVEELALSTKTAALTTLPEETNTQGGKDMDNGTTTNNNVEQVVKPPVDEHTQMEARAYASFMRGNLALETNQWQMACAEYQMAMQLCESLAKGLAANSCNDDNGNGGGAEDGDLNVHQLELFDFFHSRAKNVIAPLLKYCQYELQVSFSMYNGENYVDCHLFVCLLVECLFSISHSFLTIDIYLTPSYNTQTNTQKQTYTRKRANHPPKNYPSSNPPPPFPTVIPSNPNSTHSKMRHFNHKPRVVRPCLKLHFVRMLLRWRRRMYEWHF